MDPLLSYALSVLAGYAMGWWCARQSSSRYSVPCYWAGEDLVDQGRRYERLHDVTPNHELDPFADRS